MYVLQGQQVALLLLVYIFKFLRQPPTVLINMAPSETRQWLLNKKPIADPVLEESADSTFKLTITKIPEIQDNQLLVKTIYISNDPAQRGWIGRTITKERLYTAPVEEGDVMRAFAIGEVVASKSKDVKEGTLVNGGLNWTEYAVVNAGEVRPLQVPEGLSPSVFIGAFGGPGMTAYYGLTEIVKATKDDAIVVSGAAGATGSMAVQIAKNLIGCKKVIGIAGNDEKCRWVESIGADVCINYKKPSFEDDLIAATDGYVELYYDNVGGEILDLMLSRMKRFGRIAACGAIANYNREGEPYGLKRWFEVISNRIEIKGFIVTDAVQAGKAMSMIGALIGAFKEGKIQITKDSETIVDTKFEDVPKTWSMLFSGGNTGKLVTKLV